MPKKTRKGSLSTPDLFGNVYKIALQTAVADTTTKFDWMTGYSIKDGLGMVLHKIEYGFTNAGVLNAAGDLITAGMSTREDTTISQLYENVVDSVIDSALVQCLKDGAGTLLDVKYDTQIVHDFTNEPGGGRLIAPKPLYFHISSSGAGAVVYCQMRIWYTWLNLDERMYRELYESMNPSA